MNTEHIPYCHRCPHSYQDDDGSWKCHERQHPTPDMSCFSVAEHRAQARHDYAQERMEAMEDDE